MGNSPPPTRRPASGNPRAVVAVVITSMVGGYRLGLVARALSWAGMGIGIAVAARFLPDVIAAVQGPDPSARLLLAVGVLLGGAFLGQALGRHR